MDQKSEEEVHQEDSSDELTEEFELSNTDEEWSEIVDHALEEEVNVEDDDIPDEFCDPIMSTLIENPIVIPEESVPDTI